VPGKGTAVTRDRRFVFVDYATQAYLALVALLVLLLHGSQVPYWPVVLAAHAAAIGLIHVLVRLYNGNPANRVLAFLRYFYPMLMYGPFYWETGKLNHLLVSGFLDPSFIRMDGRLFGAQPGLVFMERLPYLALSEIFYAAYFSYYLMIAGVALALYLRNRDHFSHYVSVTSFVFYVCYVTYILVPVVGPLVFLRDIPGYQLPAYVRAPTAPSFPASVRVGLFYRLMEWVYYPFEAPGASFPSSHVAVAIVTVYFSFLYLRWIRWPHFVAMILLCAATVYCRYHYAVDVVAGIVAAGVLIPIGNRLYFRFGNPASPRPE
jgi:membrane-associated phospholipid phosphatase